MNNNYTVYMHKFPNNKVYIGITCQSVYKRWGHKYSNSPLMKNAINKYGWENVEHIILYENLSQEDAEDKEKKLIKKFKSNQKEYGYNVANGGMHKGKTTDETKLKIRESGASKTFFKKGVSSWNKGIPQSESAKEKNRLAHTGIKQSEETIEKRKNALKGHKMSEETKLKIKTTKEQHYPNGFRHSKETREKIRQGNLGKKQSKETIEKRKNTMKQKYKNGYISPRKGKPAWNKGKNKNEYMVSNTVLGGVYNG